MILKALPEFPVETILRLGAGEVANLMTTRS